MCEIVKYLSPRSKLENRKKKKKMNIANVNFQGRLTKNDRMSPYNLI